MGEDYKDVAQSAVDWGVDRKTVIRYCEQGMVPFAEKIGRNWLIPKNAEKPLLTRNAAVRLMYYLTVFSEGGKPNLSRTGISKEIVESGYAYLVDIGCITELCEGEYLQDQLKNVTITTVGKDLIDSENAERRRKGQAEITGKLKLNTGIVEAEVKGKYKS